LKLRKEIWLAIKNQKVILSINLFVLCVLSFSGPFSLYAHAYFIDKIESMVGTDFKLSLLTYPTFLLLVSLLLPMFSIVSNYLSMKFNYSIDLSWNKRMNEVIKKIPYYQYEHEETYDKLKQVGENNLYSIIIDCGFSMISAAISIIFYTYILLKISIWLTISVIILAPIVGYFSSRIADKQYKKTFKLNPDRRRGIYKSSILRSREYAKDIRVNRCGDYMINDWFDTQKDLDSKILRIKFKYGFSSALVAKTEYIVIFINLIIVLLTYLNGSITLGIFISISNQIFTMRLLSKIQDIIFRITTTKSVRKSYTDMLGLMAENDGENSSIGNQVTIEFNNVSFKYPNEDEYVLKDITLRFNSGESIAIVGENGAGKSTLIKLLLGLYSPSEGEVLVNGINVTSLPLSKRAKIFGVAFQDYSKFSLPLRENLTLNEDEINVSGIVHSFNIDNLANSLKDGYSTLLGKSFGEGVDVSGGQWQSIAIARSIIGDKKVFIFDEPTASLDPINEVETFNKISNLTSGHISIYITHRLGFTTKVDRVVLIKDNQILEDDSFANLMSRNGEFKKMFDTQRSLYIKGDAI
jgi:ABC-type bacteriocin/lantibiotic exporter with double-glycine peptidase domain